MFFQNFEQIFLWHTLLQSRLVLLVPLYFYYFSLYADPNVLIAESYLEGYYSPFTQVGLIPALAG